MIKVFPSTLSGSPDLPPSKSYAQRFILAALLSKGKSVIQNIGSSNDVMAMIKIAEKFNPGFILGHNVLVLQGGFETDNINHFYCGESALCARLLTPVASTMGMAFFIEGSGSLLNRPVARELHNLSEMGLTIEGKINYLPFKVLKGKLQPGKYVIDASVTAQFACGLAMALPVLDGDSELQLINLHSRPYFKMTLDVMTRFGIRYNDVGDDKFVFYGNQSYKACENTVEADWSSAAIWMTASALCGDMHFENLNFDSLQADRSILKLLTLAGIKTEICNSGIKVFKAKPLGFSFQFSDCPDLFPIASVLAAYADGKSILHGTGRLQYKESDRVNAIAMQFNSMGIKTEVFDDYVEIIGNRNIPFSPVDSMNDHRLAMAFSVFAMASSEGLAIVNHECVNKSYPDFYETLQKIGGKTA